MTERRGNIPHEDRSGQDEPVRYIGVRVADELYEKVRAAAEADRRSINVWVTLVLERAVAEIEREQRDETR
jgi:predicted HicB family RNase H-like nuclease